jgi:hypothetical protein
MPANAALYLPKDAIDLTQVFETARAHKRLFGRVTHYDVTFGADVVRFNVMPAAEVAGHVSGLLRYVESLDQDATRKRDACFALQHTKTVLGLVTAREFEDNHAIWQALFRIADAYDGFVFAHGSVLLPSGAVLVGPLLEE